MGPGASAAARPPPARPVGVVHLVAEYLPFARTGGLADAVARPRAMPGATAFPSWSSCRSTVRPGSRSPDWAPAQSRSDVPVGPRTERVTLLPASRQLRARASSSSSTPATSTAPGSTARAATTTPTTAAASPSSPGGARGAAADRPAARRSLHAHDWHAALAPVYLRTGSRTPWSTTALAWCSRSTTPAFQGQFRPGHAAELGLPA